MNQKLQKIYRDSKEKLENSNDENMSQAAFNNKGKR